MKRVTSVVFIILCLFKALSSAAQGVVPPKYEYRAVWLTTIENLDWPRKPAADAAGAEQQKAQLVEILDSLKALHINTVL